MQATRTQEVHAVIFYLANPERRRYKRYTHILPTRMSIEELKAGAQELLYVPDEIKTPDQFRRYTRRVLSYPENVLVGFDCVSAPDEEYLDIAIADACSHMHPREWIWSEVYAEL